MSTNTPYYNLVKPSGAAGGDFVDITVLDGDLDLIDTALHNHDLTLATIPPVNDYVSLKRSAALAIPFNVTTVIPWDQEIEDVNGFHAANSTDIVVPAGKAGLYLITSQLSLTATNNAVSFFLTAGGTLIAEDRRFGAVAGSFSATSLSAMFRLAAGDIVQASINQLENNAKSTPDNVGATINTTAIQMLKVR